MGEIGHKFARLETLRAAGFPVPDFFCLPAAEFDRALGGLLSALPQVPSVPVADWCAAAASALSKAVPEGELAAGLLDAFDERIGAEGTAAVRACVVPGEDDAGEDSEDDPFAGMSDSFLYVPREGLLEAVARCWASAFKAEAVRYRSLKGIDPARARVAVGVQRMAPGTRSFVAFTRDPRDGSRHHIIAAAHGIGEGVVQEKADVDHFFVDPRTSTVRAEVVVKRRMVGPPAAGETDPRVTEVPDALRDAPVLTDDQAQAVADLAARVEELFGRPQDIEGTFTPDGAVHLVQARTLAGNAPDAGPRVHWGNHNITESFPGVSGALTYSQARMFYEFAFTDLYRRMGVPARRLRANAHRLPRMVGHLDGRVYLKLDEPTPRQRPWAVVATIAPFVRQGATLAGNRAAEARAAADARRRLRAACRDPLRRSVLTALLSLMRWFVRTREDARFARTQLFGLSREVLWRLGGHLAEAGLLDDPMDVHDLTVEEVIGAFDGTLPGADLRGLAAVRRAERDRHRSAPPAPPLLSLPAGRPVAAALPHLRPAGGPDPDDDADDVRGLLRGLGSSGGTVRGRAKIVLDPGIAPADCAGRILVARETDPGWLPLMIAASGLVVERGTLLSHTAVTGRLLGVPAAVAVGGAVRRIPDGAWIELDGRAGTVRVLDERPAG